MTTLAVDVEAGFRVEIDGAVATIVLDRPDRMNCQGPATWSALTRVRAALPADVRVIVIRGEGRAFSAGLDRDLLRPGAGGILELPTLGADVATARIAEWQSAFDWTSDPSVVSIAAVQGHAIGGGFQLALGTDIRIVADDVRFCMAETTLGIVPDLGGTKRLVDLVGVSRATEICLTGRRVDAGEALRIGLASHAVPVDELGSAVGRTVAALLVVDRDAAAETKALLAAAHGRSQTDQQRAEREAQYRRLRTLTGHAE